MTKSPIKNYKKFTPKIQSLIWNVLTEALYISDKNTYQALEELGSEYFFGSNLDLSSNKDAQTIVLLSRLIKINEKDNETTNRE